MAEENADVGLSAAEADELLSAYTGYKPGEDSAFGLTSEESDALLKSFEQQQYEPTVLEPEERQRTIVSEVYEDDPRRLSPGSQPLAERVDVQKRFQMLSVLHFLEGGYFQQHLLPRARILKKAG